MENNTLGDNIARFRKAAGLTQEELGTTVGVSAQAVSRWECGGAPSPTPSASPSIPSSAASPALRLTWSA